MKPSAFEYHRPATAGDAVAMLEELGDEARILAGGQSLVPMLALRLTMFDHLIDVTRVPELRGIERDGSVVRIGAGTTEAEIEASAEVASAVPLLARATPLIGHFQIRNRGTIGGSIAHADPAAEYPAVAVALDATIEVLNAAGARTIEAADFFTGLWDTAMEEGDLLTAVSFPIWSGRCGFAVDEVARRHGDFAQVGVAAAVAIGDEGEVRRAGIAVAGVATEPVIAVAVVDGLVGQQPAAALVEQLAAEFAAGLKPPADLHGTAEYRRQLVRHLLPRAVDQSVRAALT